MATTMRALAASAYGPIENSKVVELPMPEPGPGEVRVRVMASALNPADGKTLLGKVKLLHAKVFPLVVGWDLSGVIDAVGSGPTDLRVGQEVFGFHAYSRATKLGALAEYTVLPATQLAAKPANVSHESAAAAATVGITALQALRDYGRMTVGQAVLITGASGGVGSAAIGVARRLGGVVDAVSSSANADFVRGLGVRAVFDRGDKAWLAQVEEKYSVVLDAASAFGLIGMRKILVPGGTYVSTLPSAGLVSGFLAAPFLRRRCRLVMVRPRRADLEWLAQALRKGLSVPIARVFPIREAAGAIEDFTTSGARGKIAIRVEGGF